MAELIAIQAVFPLAKIRLCSFHVASAVKRVLQRKGIMSTKQIATYIEMFRDRETAGVRRNTITSEIKWLQRAPQMLFSISRSNGRVVQDYGLHTALTALTST